MTLRATAPSSNHLSIPLLAARVAFASSAVCLVLLAALHVIKPELDPSWRLVSEYAIGTHGWVMTLCFLAQSLGCAALFIAIRSQVRGWVGYLGLFLLLTAALAPAMAAVFPSDPITISPAEVSATGHMHVLSAMIGIPSLPIAAMLISFHLARQPAWSSKRGPILWSAVAALFAFVLMVAQRRVQLPQRGTFGPEVLIGWPNRFLILTYCGWVMTLGWQAAKLARS